MFPFFTIDIGNTLTKVFKWCSFSDFTKADLSQITHNDFKIVCSVKKEPNTFLNSTNVKDFFENKHFFSMPVNYEQSLGMDRLVCSYFAFKNSKQNSVVIDAGTFTKIEFISNEGYMGGFILPGVELLKKTYSNGAQLQEFPVDFDFNRKQANTSQEAINRGFTQSILAPIRNILKTYEFSDLYITGGNSQCIYEYLKTEACQGASIHLIPDLIHISLALIATKVLK